MCSFAEGTHGHHRYSPACTHTEINKESHTVKYHTSLELLPGSSVLLVQITEVFLLCKFCFGEKAPPQTKQNFASGVGSFQQLPYLSPHKDCKEAGLNLHEICLAQLYKHPPASSQLNFTSICSQSIVEFNYTYLQVPDVKIPFWWVSIRLAWYLICLKL